MTGLRRRGYLSIRARPAVGARIFDTLWSSPQLRAAMTQITGRSLSLERVEEVAQGAGGSVTLSPEAREEMEEARRFVERLVAEDRKVYGVNTGFGRLADRVISRDRQRALQRNLVRSHASGVGPSMEREEVRAIMVLRANALARGHSGCRALVVDRLLAYLNRGIHPVVPRFGSVGASGDLAPLAHVALALAGEGEVEVEGVIRPAREALEEADLEPLELLEKEGLALINGTQATAGVGILALLAAERALDTAEVAGAMSLEGLRGTPDAFRPEVHQARPHGGQRASAARLWALLQDSEIRESHRHGDPRVQDAYSIRCMPQIHGAAREVLGYVRGILETEANSTTDNPLVFPELGEVVSAGNFHAQVVAQALDFLVMALVDVASVSERRTERLLNPDLSGHPAFLSVEPGIGSGLMIAQVTAVDLLGELRVLAHPASVDSVPTSAGQEDHVSMGLAAARKAGRAVTCLEYVLGVELLAGAQALEFLAPLKPAPAVARARELVRARVPPLEEDRSLRADLEGLRELVASGALARLVDEALEAGEAPDRD